MSGIVEMACKCIYPAQKEGERRERERGGSVLWSRRRERVMDDKQRLQVVMGYGKEKLNRAQRCRAILVQS